MTLVIRGLSTHSIVLAQGAGAATGLGPGAAGTVLTSNGAGADPSYQALPSGTPGYTVGTLPAGTTGQRAYVTDATAPTFLGTLTGGGTVVCPVFHNGSAWVAG